MSVTGEIMDVPMDVVRDEPPKEKRRTNPLYGNPSVWDSYSLSEQLEFIRKHLCTGPCGSSGAVIEQRSRISESLTQAIAVIKFGELWPAKS